MLSSTQRDKARGHHQWSKNKQQKADFNHKISRKLKQRIGDLRDMTLLMENLPERVLNNINLIEDLPVVIKFVEVFLRKNKPVPVSEHASGEVRAFISYALKVDKKRQRPGGMVIPFDGENYIIRTITRRATSVEVANCMLLKNHIDNIERYIDPSVVSIVDKPPYSAEEIFKEVTHIANMAGPMQLEFTTPTFYTGIPTNPPRRPRIIKMMDQARTGETTNLVSEDEGNP